jgi:hypothetical protein
LFCHFNFEPTAIGSLPHCNPEEAVHFVLKNLPRLPFWPQLPNRSFKERMECQFSEGLPGLEIRETERQIFFQLNDLSKISQQVNQIYSQFETQALELGYISPEFAAGFYSLLEVLKDIPLKEKRMIKSQITGPITLGYTLLDETRQPIFYNEVIADVVTKVLSMKALWQCQKFKELGYETILFIDEPYLSSYGSGYFNLPQGEVKEKLTQIIRFLQNHNVKVGLHCCGNTDWAMVLNLGLDIISFDAWSFWEKFSLYPQEIGNFLAGGGSIAWGIVPTESEKLEEVTTTKILKNRLEQGIENLVKKGISRELIEKNSLLTPTCGASRLSLEETEKVFRLLTELSSELRSL